MEAILTNLAVAAGTYLVHVLYAKLTGKPFPGTAPAIPVPSPSPGTPPPLPQLPTLPGLPGLGGLPAPDGKGTLALALLQLFLKRQAGAQLSAEEQQAVQAAQMHASATPIKVTAANIDSPPVAWGVPAPGLGVGGK